MSIYKFEDLIVCLEKIMDISDSIPFLFERKGCINEMPKIPLFDPFYEEAKRKVRSIC